MNVQDTGSAAANTGTLSTTLAGQGLLTGLGMGSMGITYSNLGALNISLGNGNNTFNILSTQAGTTTTLNNGSGQSAVNVQSTAGPTIINTPSQGVEIVNVGSLAPVTGGNVNGIQGALTVNDDNYGTLNVDDTGSTAANTGTLTDTTLTGLGMAGITYNHLAALNISLGSGANTFNILSTSSRATPPSMPSMAAM